MMTIALAFETDISRVAVAFTVPPYRPSSLLIVIAALVLAVAGLAIDVALQQPVGAVGLLTTAAALGVVLAFLEREIRRSKP